MHDWKLLREYVEHNSQTAFAALVEQHVNLVYATCLRELGDATQAEDVAQVVFLILSRKAASLREGTVLAGWLFQTARFACKNALKRERRRQQSEQKAAEHQMHQMETGKTGWSEIEPLLHDGLSILAKPERDAVLLRFFENRSLRETGAALGISEDAARMRVARALEKLRRHFARHGFAASIAVLVALLTENAAHAAPASFLTKAAHFSNSAPTAGNTATFANPQVTALSQHVLRSMQMQKLAMIAGLSALLLASGVSLSHLMLRSTIAPQAPTAHPTRTGADGKKLPSQAATQNEILVSAPVAQRAPIVMPPGTTITGQRQSKTTAMPPQISTRPLHRKAAPPARVALTEAPLVEEMSASQQLSTAEPGVPPTQPDAPVAASSPNAAPNFVPSVATLPVPEAATVQANSESEAAPLASQGAALPEALVPAPLKGASTPGKKAARRNPLFRRAPASTDLRGRVLSVNDSADSISIQQPSHDATTVLIPESARVFVNNKIASLEDIQTGMTAKIHQENGEGAFIIHAHARVKNPAQKPQPLKEVKRNKRLQRVAP